MPIDPRALPGYRPVPGGRNVMHFDPDTGQRISGRQLYNPNLSPQDPYRVIWDSSYYAALRKAPADIRAETIVRRESRETARRNAEAEVNRRAVAAGQAPMTQRQVREFQQQRSIFYFLRDNVLGPFQRRDLNDPDGYLAQLLVRMGVRPQEMNDAGIPVGDTDPYQIIEGLGMSFIQWKQSRGLMNAEEMGEAG